MDVDDGSRLVGLATLFVTFILPSFTGFLTFRSRRLLNPQAARIVALGHFTRFYLVLPGFYSVVQLYRVQSNRNYEFSYRYSVFLQAFRGSLETWTGLYRVLPSFYRVF